MPVLKPGPERKDECEGATPSVCALGLDGAPMVLNDLACNRKPQTAVFDALRERVSRPVELLEYQSDLRGRMPMPVVRIVDS